MLASALSLATAARLHTLRRDCSCGSPRALRNVSRVRFDFCETRKRKREMARAATAKVSYAHTGMCLCVPPPGHNTTITMHACTASQRARMRRDVRIRSCVSALCDVHTAVGASWMAVPARRAALAPVTSPRVWRGMQSKGAKTCENRWPWCSRVMTTII